MDHQSSVEVLLNLGKVSDEELHLSKAYLL